MNSQEWITQSNRGPAAGCAAALDALATACRHTPGYLARVVHDTSNHLDGIWPARRGAAVLRSARVIRFVRFCGKDVSLHHVPGLRAAAMRRLEEWVRT